jgi:hypothetical protein
MPAERTKVVYLGAPLDEFARPRSAEETARRGPSSASRPTPLRSARSHG